MPEFQQHDLVFDRVAVTDDQIDELDLPTRPTKIVGNRHAIGWDADMPSVELDAIPPNVLRGMVRGCVEGLVDPEQLGRIRQIEKEEREMIALFGWEARV